MKQYILVLLPLPLSRIFTYEVSSDAFHLAQIGIRVAVPFGKNKIQTGIVVGYTNDVPTEYEVKSIEFFLDEEPIITIEQLKLWKWISQYYMCSMGQVMKAALPKSFLLESETTLVLKDDSIYSQEDLTDNEFLIVEALENKAILKIEDIMSITERKTVMPIINNLIAKDILTLKEEVRERYKPKTENFVRLHENYANDNDLRTLLNTLERAPKQKDVILALFTLRAKYGDFIKRSVLIERSQSSSNTIKALLDKDILVQEAFRIDRVKSNQEKGSELKTLNTDQQKAIDNIKVGFENSKPVLLHGVTSSGKTEVYVRLILEELEKGNQVLYLLPEIALTTQLISRLQNYFKHKVLVYHSRYTTNERLETWNHILASKEPYVIIGARSAVLLPFSKLGLIIVDEEHESSFKQFDPAPRYNARDTAIVLGQLFNSRILLGSATPSLESYYNVKSSKYHLAELKRRFNNVLMPEINMVDLKQKHRKKKMKGHFSDTLIAAIQECFENQEQVILFQNRRGYSPFMECNTCGHSPQCPRCDVSLTYHKYKGQLRCHYCGFHTAAPTQCASCTSNDLSTKGLGTEQVEQEFKELFPNHSILRMDLDTTRGKNSYQTIINQVENQEVDCLVGTQMLTKGLDFRNVALVGVLNADSMLNFPDFRSHERCFQLLTQVAGRSGRTNKRGKVLIQSYSPDHQILQQVSVYDYHTMYKQQVEDRYQFKYPPYYRMIKITFKAKDITRVQEAANWFYKGLQPLESVGQLLGPEFPAVARIRNQYLMNIFLKADKKHSIASIKNHINKVKSSFESIAPYRSVRCVIDVDPY